MSIGLLNPSRKAQKCKALLRKKEQEIKVQEQSKITLDEVIDSIVTDFPTEEGKEEIESHQPLIEPSIVDSKDMETR